MRHLGFCGFYVRWLIWSDRYEIMMNPCKNCEKRGCGVYHDRCESYQNFRKIMFGIYKKRIFNNDAQADEFDRMNVMKTGRNSNGIGHTHKK